MIIKPVDLLQQELDKLLSARRHSIESMEKGEIDPSLHEKHLRNLTPMIKEYKFVIRIVRYNTE